MKNKNHKETILFRILVFLKTISYIVFLITNISIIIIGLNGSDKDSYLTIGIYFLLITPIIAILIESIYQSILYILWGENFGNIIERVIKKPIFSTFKNLYKISLVVSLISFYLYFTYKEPIENFSNPIKYEIMEVTNKPSLTPTEPIESEDEKLARCIKIKNFSVERTDNGLEYYKEYYLVFRGIIQNTCDELIVKNSTTIKIVKSEDSTGKNIIDNNKELTEYTGSWQPNETFELRITKTVLEEDQSKFYSVKWGPPINKDIEGASFK